MFSFEPIRLAVACETDIGRVREVNQDSVYAWCSNDEPVEPRGLLVVADGVGGHRAGEVASQLAVSTLVTALSPMLRGDSVTRPLASGMMTRLLFNAINRANEAILLKAQENPDELGDMGTTLACALVLGKLAILGSIGDSRIYRLSGDELTQLSRDHSLVAELVLAGLLSAEAAAEHPRRNVLTQVLGSREKINPDLRVINLFVGDRLLVCSDGLWGGLKDTEELAALLSVPGEVEKSVKSLIEQANRNGGQDNIGVAMLDVLPAVIPSKK